MLDKYFLNEKSGSFYLPRTGSLLRLRKVYLQAIATYLRLSKLYGNIAFINKKNTKEIYP